jgi:hypothetical protein
MVPAGGSGPEYLPGARFGEDPDVDEVDAYVRSVMQAALDRLGRERRIPVLG